MSAGGIFIYVLSIPRAMEKRGQITVFLLVGVLLLLLFAGILYFTSISQKKSLQAEEEHPLASQFRARIAAYVESCLRSTATPGLFLLARQGGRIYPPPDTVLITENELISFAYRNGERITRKELMEKDLERFISATIKECLDQSPFKEEGLRFSAGQPEADVLIQPENINLNLHYPLELQSGDDMLRIQDFTTTLPVRLGRILSIEEKIIEMHEERPFLYNLGSFAQQNVTVVAFPLDEETSIFSIYDEDSVLNSLPFYYWFALRDETVNRPPVLQFIPPFVATRGVPVDMLVDAEDDDALTFSTDDEHFPITSDGLLHFTPQEAGTFLITITVEDTKGQQDSQQVRVVVEG